MIIITYQPTRYSKFKLRKPSAEMGAELLFYEDREFIEAEKGLLIGLSLVILTRPSQDYCMKIRSLL
jgi:hypothetical protein